MNGVGHGQPGDPMFTLQSSAVHGIAATLTKNYATHHGRTAGNNGGVAEGQLIPEITPALTVNYHKQPDSSCSSKGPMLIPEISPAIKQCDYKGPSSDGDGLPLLPVAFVEGGHGVTLNNVAEPLSGGGGKPGQGYPAVAFQPRIALNGRGDMGDAVNALQAQSGQTGKGDAAPCVATGYAVRRLTPRECERLQGFPDDYTLLPGHKADGPRYKALGNSMATPVIRWIGERIALLEARA